MNKPDILNINVGYGKALKLAKSHYENFPVVSLLVPKDVRKHLAIIYWFARTADDFADEGNYTENERLNNLNDFEYRLIELLKGNHNSDFEIALSNTIKTKKSSSENLFNLIKAFKQDVTKKRHLNFDEVLYYCSNSANPVGRLILELVKIKDEKAFYYSDKICTALQITNFIQDTGIDFDKGRIYYPLDEMQKFGVTEKMFELKENNLNFKGLVEFSIDRTQQMFNEGKGLLNYLSGRIKFEIAAKINGGEFILNKIKEINYDVLNFRPVLSKMDYIKLFLKSFF
ncbi:MAG: squalene synthase HpnC [Ignavibacteriaceae bacterium]|nr:squalene synthase HpnC [Ignavibacteriaceae bacterium]